MVKHVTTSNKSTIFGFYSVIKAVIALKYYIRKKYSHHAIISVHEPHSYAYAFLSCVLCSDFLVMWPGVLP